MNKVILMGRLTGDPETRKTQNGNTATRFRLAVDRRGKKQDGRKNADFVPVVAWDKLGEFAAQYLKKGTRVVVEGRMTSGSYQKEDQTVYTLEVTAESIEFAESKAAEQTRKQKSQPTPEEPYSDPGYFEGIDDECPF
jgi:single-strand DNA-binding protein